MLTENGFSILFLNRLSLTWIASSARASVYAWANQPKERSESVFEELPEGVYDVILADVKKSIKRMGYLPNNI